MAIAASPETPRRRPPIRRLVFSIALAAVLVAAIAYGVHWWTTGRFLRSTDDAYLRADSVTVAPKISGYVSAVLVGDNQDVAAGEVLVRVDPENYRAVLIQQTAMRKTRQADIDVAQATLAQQGAAVAQAQAKVAGDQVDLRHAADEAARYRGLAAEGAETAERASDMKNQRDRAEATLAGDQAALDAAKRRVETLRAQVEQAQAQLGTSDASIHEAGIDLGNTAIRAAIAGRVGDRTVRVGQYVQPGTRLLTIVPVRDVYVVANFKETQLEGMRVGQPATISVDALGGRDLRAVVDSFAPGTGSQFALLPPENATGNFTKIVQRVPVRLRLLADEAQLRSLVPGLSVTATIDTRQTAR